MKMVFQQKVQEKEAKLKQSEEELYARHREMKDALEKQRTDLEDKKRRIESGRPLTPEKTNVSCGHIWFILPRLMLTSSRRERKVSSALNSSRFYLLVLGCLLSYCPMVSSLPLVFCHHIHPAIVYCRARRPSPICF